MGNKVYKQYINNSSEVTDEELESFAGKYAKIECVVPCMKTDSFDYIKMEYGRITITIYDTNDTTDTNDIDGENMICCINSFYRFDQQMVNTFGKIESISIEEKIIKQKRWCIFNYLLGEQIYFDYEIKIKLENMNEYSLNTDESFRKFDGSHLHNIPEATPSNYFILNHD